MINVYKACIFFCMVFQSTFVLSQDKIDSLINLFNHETNPDTRIGLSFEIAKLTYRSDPEICKQVVIAALSDSINITDKYMFGKNLNSLGIVYQYQSQFDSADYYFSYCLHIGKQMNNEELEYKAYSNLALNSRNKGEFEKAIEYYIIVLKNHEKNNDMENAAGVLNDMGNTYLYMRNYEMGIDYQKKALKVIEHIDSMTNITMSIKANTLNSIGYTFNALGKNDSALYYYEKSLELKKETNNLFSWCNTKNNICSLLRDEPEKCIACFQELLEIQHQLKDRRGIVRTKINLAVSYGDLGRDQESLDENLDILNNYADVCDNEMMATLYKNIAGSYYFLKDYEKAYESRKKYDQYQDSLRNEFYNNQILEITEKYQVEKKEKEIASQNLEIAAKDLKISNRNTFLYGLGGSLFALLFLSLFIVQRNKRISQQEKNKAIIAERDIGLVAVFNAQEEERRRVAKDLHDGIGQQIGAVSLHFQSLANKIIALSDDFQDDLQKIKKIITDTGTDVRNISHKMMPRALSERGLVDALADMLDISLSNSNIAYKFEHFNMEERLAQNIEVGLYRIAQELINNILKHSGATNVDIQLIKRKEHCILLVQDDGVGIEDKDSDGIGIQNMNSRLSALNGVLNLESDSSSGTTAMVRIAL